MANVSLRGGATSFYGMFLNNQNYVPFDLATDWKRPIDACRFIGANLVVFWGDIAQGIADIPAYVANRRKIVEYASSQGMYCLPYASYSYAGWGGLTNAQAISVFEQDAPAMASYKNVIGYVTWDEPYLSSLGDATVQSYCAAQYAAVKAVVPADFPVCTNPWYQNTIFDYTGTHKTQIDGAAPYCDFFACHPLTQSVALADSSALRAAYPGKEIIMPSCVNGSDGDSGIPALWASQAGLVGANGFRGTAWWLVRDLVPGSDTTGMFNADFTAKTAKTGAFVANLPSPVTYYPHGHRGAAGSSGRPVFAPWTAA